MFSALLRLRPDLMYCIGLYQVPFCYLFSRILGCKLVYEAHALAHKEARQTSAVSSFLSLIAESLTGILADEVISLSEGTSDFYYRLGKNIHFFPVFVDTKLFRVREKERQAATKTVGVVGSFFMRGNLHALEFLQEHYSEFDERIKFIVVGESPLVLSLERVTQIGFVKGEERYAELVSSFDALLVPIDHATYGPKNKIIEAMASGVPVITTSGGIIGLDYAAPGHNLLVFEEKDIPKKVNIFLFEKDLLESVARNARLTIENHYSEGAVGESLTRILGEILACN